MKITPIDIRHKEFKKAMRGYSEEEVDIFLDDVADDFEFLFKQNMELQDEVHRLREKVAQYESLKETLQKTLLAAQQQADATLANARKESELILRDAEMKARSIVAESYAEKQKVEQSIIQLKRLKDDFAFKLRSLLEAHLNLLAQADEAADSTQPLETQAGTGDQSVADEVATVETASDVEEQPSSEEPFSPIVEREPVILAGERETSDAGEGDTASSRESPVRRFFFGNRGHEPFERRRGEAEGGDFEW